MPPELKDTLNLPVTDFPMRANLVKREPERLQMWESDNLYHRILEKNRSAKGNGKVFVLHDGPPFTSGDVHIGTALNKVIKDAIVRYKSLRGYESPYVPGYDSHGLPIEQKVMQEMQKEGKDYTPLEIRKRCAEFAAEYKVRQDQQFIRLGVLGDWENPYWTIHPAYEAVELETLAKIVEKDLIYRSKKPVYWSIPYATALAEAEIEYKDHKSPSIYVKFELPAEESVKIGLEGPLNVVIWTTTPWTLPANLAIALHPEVRYEVVTYENEQYLLAEPLVEDFLKKTGWSGADSGKILLGKEFEGLKARHPFIDRDSLLVLADYVTTESGTGCVHTAPGHGLDDYVTGLKYGLEIYAPVDDEGKFVDDGQLPESLVGLSLLEVKGRSPANKGVLQIIENNGSLLHFEVYHHQYPHCWRSKTPVIFRAMDQWFIELDKDGLRSDALSEIDKLAANHGFIPAWGENRIRGAVENRPDWCISRQRSWGVPIPAFYDENGEAYLSGPVIRGIAAKVRDHGTDIWFDWSAEQLLKGIDLPEGWPAPSQLKCGRDTLDVWIDSANSQNSVLLEHPELYRPCDLYFEGSDQHRGWFQSSLWVGIMTHGDAPFNKVITHGFMVNEDGTKISKSDGSKKKPQTSDAYISQFGADVVRLWLCSQDYRGDVPVSEKIIKNISNSYRSLRNTLRYQIGNLHDFDPATQAIPYGEMDAIDQWALHQTATLVQTVESNFDHYEFHRGYQAIINFVTVTLSSSYHDILKDRLYTLAHDHPLRRSSQTALDHIFRALVTILNPICPFTTEEAWAYYQSNSDFADSYVAEQPWPVLPQTWLNVELNTAFDGLLGVKELVNEQLETLRQDKKIGQGLDSVVSLTVGPAHPARAPLEHFSEKLAELFQVSEVRLSLADTDDTDASIHLEAVPAESLGYQKCPRSWRWVPELTDTAWGPVSPRDAQALESLNLSNP